MKNITLRQETNQDHQDVENLTREAFWNHYVPGCDEHYLIHIMRDIAGFIHELDIVAEVAGQIVGNIVYTKAAILGDEGKSHEVITFGPISVLPDFQGKGIGGRLIEHTRELATGMGFKAILIYGDPAYYSRVGFLPAENFGIGTADNQYAAALQAFELVPGSLSYCAGRFMEGSIYEIDPKAAEAFDKNFPHKEKFSGLPSQLRFQETLAMRKPRT